MLSVTQAATHMHSGLPKAESTSHVGAKLDSFEPKPVSGSDTIKGRPQKSAYPPALLLANLKQLKHLQPHERAQYFHEVLRHPGSNAQVFAELAVRLPLVDREARNSLEREVMFRARSLEDGERFAFLEHLVPRMQKKIAKHPSAHDQMHLRMLASQLELMPAKFESATLAVKSALLLHPLTAALDRHVRDAGLRPYLESRLISSAKSSSLMRTLFSHPTPKPSGLLSRGEDPFASTNVQAELYRSSPQAHIEFAEEQLDTAHESLQALQVQEESLVTQSQAADAEHAAAQTALKQHKQKLLSSPRAYAKSALRVKQSAVVAQDAAQRLADLRGKDIPNALRQVTNAKRLLANEKHDAARLPPEHYYDVGMTKLHIGLLTMFDDYEKQSQTDWALYRHCDQPTELTSTGSERRSASPSGSSS